MLGGRVGLLYHLDDSSVVVLVEEVHVLQHEGLYRVEVLLKDRLVLDKFSVGDFSFMVTVLATRRATYARVVT